MIKLTRKQIADLRGCIPGTVSNAHLPKDSRGLYDLLNPEVWEYVTEPTIKKEIYELKRTMEKGHEDNTPEGLKAKDMETNILLKERRIRAFDLTYATEKKELIPIDQLGILIGYLASGIRNNFLQIGNRIARGNVKLRDRIEKEIKKSIEKTMDTAEKELRKYSEKLIEGMEEE